MAETYSNVTRAEMVDAAGVVVGCEHGVTFNDECNECSMEMETTDAAARLDRENAHRGMAVALRRRDRAALLVVRTAPVARGGEARV